MLAHLEEWPCEYERAHCGHRSDAEGDDRQDKEVHEQ
jgi:hypothetical protein